MDNHYTTNIILLYSNNTSMLCVSSNGGSRHISVYVSISWIISQLNALGKNWFPLLQTTSLMRVSFRAPADTNTHHQTHRKCDECSNNTCHHKTEGMRRRPYNSLMRGNMLSFSPVIIPCYMNHCVSKIFLFFQWAWIVVLIMSYY